MVPQAAEEGTAREGEEPSMDTMQALKEAEAESVLQEPPQVQREAPVPSAWQIALLVIAVLSGWLMWFMRQSAARKWR
jgi:hypothetical protein